MARPTKEIKKNKLITIRVEPAFRVQYAKFCKRNKFKMAERIRDFMIDDLNTNNNGKS